MSRARRKKVTLTEIGGTRERYGLGGLVNGPMDDEKVNRQPLKSKRAWLQRDIRRKSLCRKFREKEYAAMYGPTTGDRVRLADTSLIVEVEKDYVCMETKPSLAEANRSGWHGTGRSLSDEECLDMVITSALVIDSTGIYKADIGIKDGKISGIGKAGNPRSWTGVTPGMIIGASTEALAGEGLILTAGGIDTHIHFISPTQIHTALYSGVTTMIGGGVGPADGTNATTCTPGKFNIHKMLEASEGMPMNLGYLGKRKFIGSGSFGRTGKSRGLRFETS